MKKNNKAVLSHYIITSALIWGATIVGCALMLKETFSQIALLLTGAAAGHLIIVWGSLVTQLKKQRAEENAKTA